MKTEACKGLFDTLKGLKLEAPYVQRSTAPDRRGLEDKLLLFEQSSVWHRVC